MVVVHSYRPHWPDELALAAGDVILVLSKHEEERWFGRRQDGQQGYFPASCVMELSQVRFSARLCSAMQQKPEQWTLLGSDYDPFSPASLNYCTVSTFHRLCGVQYLYD